MLRATQEPASVRPTDRDLLARFAAGDEAAFATLVARHGGMVHGVCRRHLSTTQDAEDACQATFMVLARKAKRAGWHPSAANWLYATARRVAARINRDARRRVRREGRAVVSESVSPLDAMTVREAFAALDEELARLPARYREPLVHCYLEGLTRDEAADRLAVPGATLKSQLERGRRRLADALTRRGASRRGVRPRTRCSPPRRPRNSCSGSRCSTTGRTRCRSSGRTPSCSSTASHSKGSGTDYARGLGFPA